MWAWPNRPLTRQMPRGASAIKPPDLSPGRWRIRFGWGSVRLRYTFRVDIVLVGSLIKLRSVLVGPPYGSQGSFETEMADIASVFGRHEFLIRRLHSLTGLIPVGVFLTVHLLTNMGILDDTYQQRVDLIHSPGERTLEVAEWAGIFLPICSTASSARLSWRGESGTWPTKPKPGIYATPPPDRSHRLCLYLLARLPDPRLDQQLRVVDEHVTRPLGGGLFDARHAEHFRRFYAVQQAGPWAAVAYAIGILASVYHFANGLFTMGITWGVWTGPGRRIGPRSFAPPSAWRWPPTAWRRCSDSGSITSVNAREPHGETIGNDHRRKELAGMAAAIKLAELECEVILMSLLPGQTLA